MFIIPNDAYVMIIGAMKCGTTSLYDYLKDHPSISICKLKEPEFFSSKQNHGCNVKKYEDLWDFDCSKHQVAIEVSTGYTKYPYEQEIPKKIYEYGINPKFIYLVRNPFDRIVSHYNFMKTNPNFDLNKQLSDEYFINLSLYYSQINQYFKYFPDKSRYLVIDSAYFFDKPQETVKQVLKFLNSA